MRQFRNPRYAPESLERKLSPSSYIVQAPAEYAPLSAAQSRLAKVVAVEPPPVEPVPTPLPQPQPEPGTGEPPWGSPSDPAGPREPY